MAGTITTDGFFEMLNQGFENLPVAVRLLDGSDNIVVFETTTLTAQGDEVGFQNLVLNIDSNDTPVTIEKITLFANNKTIWEYDVNYAFPSEGSLTLDLKIGLGDSPQVTNVGAEYILKNGLLNLSISQVATGGAPILRTSSFGAPTNNTISMSGSVVFDVPSGTTITGLDTSGAGNLISRISGLNYAFTESGTLTLTNYTITLNND
jgi:hypothetical protein